MYTWQLDGLSKELSDEIKDFKCLDIWYKPKNDIASPTLSNVSTNSSTELLSADERFEALKRGATSPEGTYYPQTSFNLMGEGPLMPRMFIGPTQPDERKDNLASKDEKLRKFFQDNNLGIDEKDFIRIIEYFGRKTTPLNNSLVIDFRNRVEQFNKDMSAWSGLMEGFNNWRNGRAEHNGLLTQYVEDGQAMVRLSLKRKPSYFDFIMCRPSTNDGQTYAAPVRLVMQYYMVAGVKTNASAMMYAHMAEIRKGLKNEEILMLDAIHGSEAMIIAAEIIAQQVNRHTDYQSSSANYQHMVSQKKNK